MTPRLDLDPTLVARARELARLAAEPVIDLARQHTTVSVERAVLRLAGLTGTDPLTGEGAADNTVPWVNRVVDAVRDQVGLEQGVALPVWHALTSGSAPSLQSLAESVGAGTATPCRGSTGWSTPSGRRSGSSRAWRCRCGTR